MVDPFRNTRFSRQYFVGNMFVVGDLRVENTGRFPEVTKLPAILVIPRRTYDQLLDNVEERDEGEAYPIVKANPRFPYLTKVVGDLTEVVGDLATTGEVNQSRLSPPFQHPFLWLPDNWRYGGKYEAVCQKLDLTVRSIEQKINEGAAREEADRKVVKGELIANYFRAIAAQKTGMQFVPEHNPSLSTILLAMESMGLITITIDTQPAYNAKRQSKTPAP